MAGNRKVALVTGASRGIGRSTPRPHDPAAPLRHA